MTSTARPGYLSETTLWTHWKYQALVWDLNNNLVNFTALKSGREDSVCLFAFNETWNLTIFILMLNIKNLGGIMTQLGYFSLVWWWTRSWQVSEHWSKAFQWNFNYPPGTAGHALVYRNHKAVVCQALPRTVPRALMIEAGASWLRYRGKERVVVTGACVHHLPLLLRTLFLINRLQRFRVPDSDCSLCNIKPRHHLICRQLCPI